MIAALCLSLVAVAAVQAPAEPAGVPTAAELAGAWAGTVEHEGEQTSFALELEPVDYDAAARTLTGVVPDGFAPVYRLPLVLRKVERIETPARAGGELRTRPAIADGVLLFQADDGFLYKLDAGSGQEKWRVRLVEKPVERLPFDNPKSRYDRSSSSLRRPGATAMAHDLGNYRGNVATGHHSRIDALIDEIEPLDFDLRAAATYGRVRAQLETGGTPIGPNDMLIAAHALSRGLSVVTDNTAEFGRVRGLKVENWRQ